MSTLNNPGVSVTFTDESFYASAGAGTVPLFIIGTHSYKSQPSGSGVAAGTLPENAGKLYAMTSQRELLQTFGNPLFYSRNGSSVHGYELNEYGLHGAYQYLGVANAAFVVNCGIDYSQLVPSAVSPVGLPVDGTYWLDTKNTSWGVFESNGNGNIENGWSSEPVIVVDDVAMIEDIIVGTTSFADAAATTYTGNGSLYINNVQVSLTTGMSLNQICSAINGANIPNVQAGAIRLSGSSRLRIVSSNAAGLNIGAGSTNVVLTGLGIQQGVASVRYTPKSTVGMAGDFAVITNYGDNRMFQKLKPESINGLPDADAIDMWFLVGSANWKAATPTRVIGKPSAATINVMETLTLSTNGTTNTTVAMTNVSNFEEAAQNINAAIGLLAADHANAVISAYVQSGDLYIVNRAGGKLVISGTGDLVAALGLTDQVEVDGNRVFYAPHTQVPDAGNKGDVWIKTTAPNKGAVWSIKIYDAVMGNWQTVDAPLFETEQEADAYYGSRKNVSSLYVKTNVMGLANDPIASHVIYKYEPLSDGTGEWVELTGSQGYEASEVAPTTDPEAGTLWYNTNIRVDIMVNDNGKWVGYKTKYPQTDPNGVILAASTPVRQSTGDSLRENDLWINTGAAVFPSIYRFRNGAWVAVNLKDSTTPGGIVFADARWSTNGELDGPQDVSAMLTSQYVDPDAPDARAYPTQTLLFNTRYSTNNVKVWRPDWFAGTGGILTSVDHFERTDYTENGYTVGTSAFPAVLSAGRWVSASGSSLDGVANFGRRAQREMIVRALGAAISSNQDIRAENVYFNLIAAPGYPELIDEMVALNRDKKEIAFVVADTPARLESSTTSLMNWAQGTANGVTGNGEDGLTTADPYVGVYYPWGISDNITGEKVMIPPSTMALRTIAYNDTVAYPWMAPAGFTRGLVTNADTVGYLDAIGNFRSVMLNDGQRAVLQQNNINPIAYMPNRGLTVFGQKTRSPISSAMDRINVARLTNYLRYHLDNLAKPFLFENNNQHTRDSAQIAFSRFMGDLVGLHALYDFLVVCDESNNTPERIDRNELWIDIAIQPEKTVEFIYIPVRLVNTDADMQSFYNTSLTNNR